MKAVMQEKKNKGLISVKSVKNFTNRCCYFQISQIREKSCKNWSIYLGHPWKPIIALSDTYPQDSKHKKIIIVSATIITADGMSIEVPYIGEKCSWQQG